MITDENELYLGYVWFTFGRIIFKRIKLKKLFLKELLLKKLICI